MKLFVEPDFDSKTIYCNQDIQLQCLEDLNTPVVELNAVDLNIKKILYRESANIESTDEIPFVSTNEKLIIKLPKQIKKDSYFFFQIEYSSRTQMGFHFIGPDNFHPNKEIQAWTQGEVTESKFWFPCIDDPQIKYPREVSVSVPNEFIVVSNGKLDEVSNKGQRKIFVWKEANPLPAYLTSIVVGQFAEIIESYEHGIDLLYYVPKDKQDRVQRSFKGTVDMMKFFESYFDTPFPYSKYAQTAVQDFEAGGMENTSCTTLPNSILLDEKAAFDDFSNNAAISTRSVISHELAHQWFGDLITCIDWSHIWLNEGFATYCEALYVEAVDGKDEFQRYMDILGALYLDEACWQYRRPLVYSKYKYPDELFDAHSYKKGAWVLHMLRNIVGSDNFKDGLKIYIERFKNHNVSTNDLRNVMQEVSGQNLEPFFRQWVYSEGHPELTIEFIEDKKLLKIIQEREPFFEFKLEVKVVFSDQSIHKSIEFPINAQKDNYIEISKFYEGEGPHTLEWISIDPELKVLKQIKSINIPQFMILNQIKDGETITERRQALRAIDYNKISEQNLQERLIQILKDRVINEDNYSVSMVAVDALGPIKLDKTLDALLECLDSKVIENRPNGESIRRNIVNAIGAYVPDLDSSSNSSRADHILDKLESISRGGTKSYYVEGAALMALGRYIHDKSFQILSEALVKPDTFNDTIPVAAIIGLGNFSTVMEKIKSNDIKENEKLELEILFKKAMDILIKKTQKRNSNDVRTAAVSSLAMFLLNKDGKTNKTIFKTLMSSLDDKWAEVRKGALAVLQTTFSPDDQVFEQDIIEHLVNKIQIMAETDLNYRVRRNAELCLLDIRGRHLAKLRTIVATKESMSKYVNEKVNILTRPFFGSSLRIKHSRHC
jgi:aminopeptidase N